jgi:RNA polymerase primary sigma factor
MVSKPKSSWNTGDPLLKLYIQDTKKYRLLSADEEREIGLRILAKDPRACNELVTSNLLFVVYLAKKFAYDQEQLMDYIAEGNRGLIAAAKRFDIRYGCKFNTLGTWEIKQKMQGMRNLRMVVSIPRNKTATRRLLESKIDQFEQQHCRLPSIAEISELVSMPEKLIAKGLEYHGRTVSIDSGETEIDYRNEFADESDNAEQKLVKASNLLNVRNIVATLPKREALIISYAYGLDGQEQMTAAEIATIMGYSKERIRQLKYKAEKKISARLRNFVDAQGRNFL